MDFEAFIIYFCMMIIATEHTETQRKNKKKNFSVSVVSVATAE